MEYTVEELREVVDLVKRKRFDDLEERWLELSESPPTEPRFYDSMTRALLKAGERDRLSELFSLMATAMLEQERPRETVEMIHTVWRYAPDFHGLAEPCRDALEALYGARPNLKQFIRAVGLDERTDLLRALQRFEEILYCDEGEVFEHKSFGIGIVEEIEPEQKRARIRFTGKAPKEFTFEGIREYLTKLERSGFRAERLRNPDGLKRRASEEPLEFLRFALGDFPEGLSQVELKDLLLDGVLAREEWDRWWAANRKAIRRDAYIDWAGTPRAPMRVRSEPRSYYEVVADEFGENDATGARLALIAEVAKHICEEPAPDDFAKRLLALLSDEFDALADDDVAGRLERTYLAHDLAHVFNVDQLSAGFDDTALLAQAEDPAPAILAVTAHDLQCRAVETLTAADADRAADVGVRMIPNAPPRLAQWLIDRLEARGKVEEVSRAVDKLLQSPRRNPDGFQWGVRQFFGGKFAALSLDITAQEIIRKMVDFMKDLQNQVDHGVSNAPTLRGVVVKLRNLLAENHYEILQHTITSLSTSEAQAVCKLFDAHAAFPDGFLMSLRHTLQQARPDIDESAGAVGEADIDPTVLYVTKESLKQRHAELQKIRSVEIPKNSREIGEAASLGDLSENAEYEAARHRQSILFSRAKELQGELERARQIDPKWVRTDCIWIGTRFRARNLGTGETETYAIMGAWDSAPEKNVLSYLTPAAGQFLKKKVGERIVVERPNAEPTKYEILAIENALN